MTKNYFQELMGEFEFHVLDDTAFGVREGYPFSVQLIKTGKRPEIIIRFVLHDNVKPVVQAFKKGKKQYLHWFFELDTQEENSVLEVLVNPPSDFYAKSTLYSLFIDIPKVLQELEIKPPEKCPLCGLGQCDVYALLDNGYRMTHQHCLDTGLELPEEDSYTPITIRGSYIRGILGAVLGAAIGALPNFAYAMASLRISAPLYAFIPILSTLLYRLLRGKARRVYSNIVVLIASIVATLGLELVWYWLTLSTGGTQVVDFYAASAMYFQTHTLFSSIREMLLSLIFLVVGFIPSGIILRRYAVSGETGGDHIRGIRFVRKSVTPIRPVGAEEDAVAAEKADVNAGESLAADGQEPDETEGVDEE